MEPTNTMPDAPKKSNGALIGAIIVILILVIGGIYLINENQKEDKLLLEENIEMMQPNQDLSESDDLDSIEADLNSQTEIEILDQQPDQNLQ